MFSSLAGVLQIQADDTYIWTFVIHNNSSCQVYMYIQLGRVSSPVILSKIMGQPSTNCNKSDLKVFLVQKNLLYKILKVSQNLKGPIQL